jgi:hypothetical protein
MNEGASGGQSTVGSVVDDDEMVVSGAAVQAVLTAVSKNRVIAVTRATVQRIAPVVAVQRVMTAKVRQRASVPIAVDCVVPI